MSCRVRWGQACLEPGCVKPARYGDLCAPHFLAATPARRAVELGHHIPTDDWDIAAAAELFLGD